MWRIIDSVLAALTASLDSLHMNVSVWFQKSGSIQPRTSRPKCKKNVLQNLHDPWQSRRTSCERREVRVDFALQDRGGLLSQGTSVFTGAQECPEKGWASKLRAALRGVGQTLQGSFSAVSKPNFARIYAFESSRRDLHNALLCTAL